MLLVLQASPDWPAAAHSTHNNWKYYSMFMFVLTDCIVQSWSHKDYKLLLFLKFPLIYTFQLENCKANLRLLYRQGGTFLTMLQAEMEATGGSYCGVQLVIEAQCGGRGVRGANIVD